MSRVLTELEAIVGWYAETAYGTWEGAGQVPFYCDPERVGGFAVSPARLAAGDDEALFRLLVTLAMYQSRRDVDIMALQRGMPHKQVMQLTAPRTLTTLVDRGRCEHLRSAYRFDVHCSVRRDFARDGATCDHRPRTPCHVKDATMAIRRMGDMGMIGTSAWLHLRDDGGGLSAQLRRVCGESSDPSARADAMVTYLAGFHRIAVKLATMFVSAVATPALAPGLTPWWPFLDGNDLVVVDANVIRVIDGFRTRGPKTYQARAAWLRRAAGRLDLRRFRPDWPQTSARLVQQAIYVFASGSNRRARGDTCLAADRCRLTSCPFHAPRRPRAVVGRQPRPGHAVNKAKGR